METERHGRPYVLHPDPCLGKALGEFLGPAPVAPVSVCLAGPGTHPVCFQGAHLVPPRLQPACGVGGGVGGSSFTFSAFTLSHHLGVCVLRPPSHEPAGKTGEHQVSKALAQIPHRWTLDVGCLLASETSSPPPRPALGRSLPHHPTLACLKGKASCYSGSSHGDLWGFHQACRTAAPHLSWMPAFLSVTP